MENTPPTAGQDYPTSPIKTFIETCRALWQNGRSALIGTVLVEFVLALLATTLLVIALTSAGMFIYFAFLQNNTLAALIYSSIAMQLPPDTASFIDRLSNSLSTLGIVAVVAMLLAAAVGTLLRATALAFVGYAVLAHQVVHFGQVMSLAFRRTLPLLAQGLLIVLTIVALAITQWILIGKLAGSTGMQATLGIYYVVLTVTVCYSLLRLAFAPQAVVSLSMGPVKAIKYSWEISRGKLVEIIGVLGIAAAISAVSELVFAFLYKLAADNSAGAMAVNISELAVGLVIGIVAVAVIAKRLQQARLQAASHKIGKLANIGVFLLGILIALISGGIQNSINPAPTFNPYGLPENTLQLENTTLPDGRSLQDALNKYYQDPQSLFNADQDYYNDLQNSSDSAEYKVN